MSVWLQFLVSAVGVVVSGIVLARAAQILARHTRLGGLLVGAVLLAVFGVRAFLKGPPDA